MNQKQIDKFVEEYSNVNEKRRMDIRMFLHETLIHGSHIIYRNVMNTLDSIDELI